ncbi:unnamed protein product [Cyclocybe aegerita]|uniref:GH18 domain-containing protein n=1 Tax=Cyclocybe aegerita TaxID=1973307 RepID=A0A8S0VUA4_CYCAE|nr:unnamed protein product [Cyclocybe aegerita]
MLPSILPLYLLASAVAALGREGLDSTAALNDTLSRAARSSLRRVSWSKYSHLTYAFAITTPDANTLALDASDEELLPQFVSTAHQNGVKASLSIGGWTGSRYFSSNVGSARNRTAFVKTVTDVATKYSLDGLDFDWEFPGVQGIGCNLVNASDTDNFLAFLQQLRNTTIGKSLILSVATYVTPWVDPTGSPSANISEFSKVLDYMAIMNYDVKSNPSVGAGPHSPLDDSCAPVGARFGSATSAVDAWTAAGMPKDQIVLGVPAYGHSFVVPSGEMSGSSDNGSTSIAALQGYPRYEAGVKRRGDRWDGEGGLDVCGATVGPGGVYTYWGLIEEGFLNDDGSVASGVKSRFDECSQTPFLYNATAGVHVSYDNLESYAIKGGFVHLMGLKGFAMWEAGGDFKDALLDSILNATQNGGPPTDKSQSTSTSSSLPRLPFVSGQFIWRHLHLLSLGLGSWFL